MKVLIFSEALAGGVLSVISDQVKVLRSLDANIEIYVFYCERNETPEDLKMKLSGCTLIPSKAKRERKLSLVSLFLEYRRVVKELTPDVIHLHSTFAGFIGRLFNSLQSRTFYTPHCYVFLALDRPAWLRKFYWYIEKYLSTKAITIACGASEYVYAKKFSSNSVLVSNGIDSASRSTKHLSEQELCDVVTVGRICAQKGVDRFLSLSRLLDASVKMKWVGGPLDSLTSDYPGVFTGWVDRDMISGFLASSKIYVSTAYWEGLPIAPLEAQQQGLPIVALTAEGINDVVIDGVTGFLCKSVEDMAIRIEELLNNRELFESFSDAARQNIIENFSLTNYEGIYRCYVQALEY